MRKLLLSGLIVTLTACGGGAPTTSAPVTTSQPAAVIKAPLRSDIVAFMGDSITYYWGPFMPAESGFTVVNWGVSGETTAQMLARFQTQIIDAPAAVGVVVIDGGIGDLIHPESGSKAFENIQQMASMADQAGIRVIIASIMLESYAGVTNPTSTQIDDLNAQLLALCDAKGYTYADYRDAMLLSDGTQDFSLYNDGLHPNYYGYLKMWAVIEPLIQEQLL